MSVPAQVMRDGWERGCVCVCVFVCVRTAVDDLLTV